LIGVLGIDKHRSFFYKINDDAPLRERFRKRV